MLGTALALGALMSVGLGGYGIGVMVARAAVTEEMLTMLAAIGPADPPANLTEVELAVWADPAAVSRLLDALDEAAPTCESCGVAPAAVVVSWPDLDRGQEFLTCRTCAAAAAGVTPGASLEDL